MGTAYDHTSVTAPSYLQKDLAYSCERRDETLHSHAAIRECQWEEALLSVELLPTIQFASSQAEAQVKRGLVKG